MAISGTFKVTLTPQDDGDFAAGRMLIEKTYFGALSASGSGQMISKRTPSGASAYFAVEEVSGTLHGRSGTFTLIHEGYMEGDSQSLEISILKGSGTGEFESISGSMAITQDEGGHHYEFFYEIAE